MAEATTGLFLLYFAIGALTRLSKTQLLESCYVVDLSDLIILITASKFGLLGGFKMLGLMTIIPLARIKLEGPLDTLLRIIAMCICLPLFAILVFLGFDPMLMILLVSALASVIWVFEILVLLGSCAFGYFVLTILRVFIYTQVLTLGLIPV